MPEPLSLFDVDVALWRSTVDEPAPEPAGWHSTNLGREDRCLRRGPHWSHRGLFAEWTPDA